MGSNPELVFYLGICQSTTKEYFDSFWIFSGFSDCFLGGILFSVLNPLFLNEFAFGVNGWSRSLLFFELLLTFRETLFSGCFSSLKTLSLVFISFY
jgi:hypothetical protein